MTQDARAQAVADLTAALGYALLKVAQVAAAGAAHAPTADLADRQATFAAEELERYRVLRRRVDELTDDADRAMGALRETMDAFYAAATPQTWEEIQTFHYIGNTLTTDFAQTLAARVDDETAAALERALTGRTQQEAFALEQIGLALEAGGTDAVERVTHFARAIVGLGLSRLREALLQSDSLEVVLGGEDAVKEVVLDLLGRHRERLERLGLESLDE